MGHLHRARPDGDRRAGRDHHRQLHPPRDRISAGRNGCGEHQRCQWTCCGRLVSQGSARPRDGNPADVTAPGRDHRVADHPDSRCERRNRFGRRTVGSSQRRSRPDLRRRIDQSPAAGGAAHRHPGRNGKSLSLELVPVAHSRRLGTAGVSAVHPLDIRSGLADQRARMGRCARWAPDRDLPVRGCTRTHRCRHLE